MDRLNGSSSSSSSFVPPASCEFDPTREVCEEATVKRCHDLRDDGGDGATAACGETDRNCTIAFEERCRQPSPEECKEEEREECNEEDEVVEDCHQVLLEQCTGKMRLGD